MPIADPQRGSMLNREQSMPATGPTYGSTLPSANTTKAMLSVRPSTAYWRSSRWTCFNSSKGQCFFLSHSVILGCSKNWFNAAVLRTVCTSDQTGFGVHLSVSLLGVSFFSFRAANVYFVFLALLNWVPAVEAFQKEITMIPVLVVLVVIAVKDALEDYRRYLFDKKVNNNKAQVFCR